MDDLKIENIKMVVFDKDGTLIDVHYYWCSMIECRAKLIVESLKNRNVDFIGIYEELIDRMGIDINTKRMKIKGPVGIKPREYIEKVALNTVLKYDENYSLKEIKEIFVKVDISTEASISKMIRVLPSVKKVLKELMANQILISIATTDLSSRAILAMKSQKLDKYFVDIVGGDLVEKAKPSPDLLEYIAKKNGLANGDIVLVGDSMVDLNMAKEFNCKFIGVKTGLFSNEFLAQSEYLINDLESMEVTK